MKVVEFVFDNVIDLAGYAKNRLENPTPLKIGELSEESRGKIGELSEFQGAILVVSRVGDNS